MFCQESNCLNACTLYEGTPSLTTHETTRFTLAMINFGHIRYNVYNFNSTTTALKTQANSTPYNLMSEQEIVSDLRWNDNVSVAMITLISYEYLLLLDKEIKYVWKRPWSLMSCLYLVVRYLGLFLALLCGFWGGLLYIPESVSYILVVLLNGDFQSIFALRKPFSSGAFMPYATNRSSYLCSSGIVLAYHRPLNRDGHLFIQST
ncbi:hypothetical protein EDD22DRAFT_86423 [Suillus occidentalis]|nr:hypothetical protein EDD22DRAFT_86423 [Suillus occidentalis]